MDNKFNEVRRLVEEDDELKTSDRYTKVRAKNHLFEWSGQQLDILLRRVAGAKKVLTNLLSKKADLVDGKVPKSQLPSDIGVDAVLFSQQTLTPQQQEQARKNIDVLSLHSNFFKVISIPNSKYQANGGIYTTPLYDKDTDTIYAVSKGVRGSFYKIKGGRLILERDYSVSDYFCANPWVYIDNKLYFFGTLFKNVLVRLNADDFSKELEVDYTGVLDSRNTKCGLFQIGDTLYCFTINGELRIVNKEDLSLSDPLFTDVVYVNNFSSTHLIVVDSQIHLYDGNTFTHTKDIPEGFEDIRSIYRLTRSRYGISEDTQSYVVYVHSQNWNLTTVNMSDNGVATGGTVRILFDILPFNNIAKITNENIHLVINLNGNICYLFSGNRYTCGTNYISSPYFPSINSRPYNWGDTDVYTFNDGIITE